MKRLMTFGLIVLMILSGTRLLKAILESVVNPAYSIGFDPMIYAGGVSYALVCSLYLGSISFYADRGFRVLFRKSDRMVILFGFFASVTSVTGVVYYLSGFATTGDISSIVICSACVVGCFLIQRKHFREIFRRV